MAVNAVLHARSTRVLAALAATVSNAANLSAHELARGVVGLAPSVALVERSEELSAAAVEGAIADRSEDAAERSYAHRRADTR